MDNNKLKIVATSGYFDPIHIGHIECLKLSKELVGPNGKLIVIINNTKQAHLKKGHEFMPLKERAEIVKAIRYVDEVFISIDEDESICKSLEAVNPDIFAKGGDRNIGNIPEVELCKKIGCKIVDGLGQKIQSSSDLIEKSKENQEQ